MRIYNKRTFGYGVFSTALGVLNLLLCFRTGFDGSGLLLALLLLLVGGGSILRGLSRDLSREDRLEALDERNRLVELKTKSKAFRLTQGISFGLMLVLLVLGKVLEERLLIGVGIGLASAYTVSMFTEVLTFCYYEKHS